MIIKHKIENGQQILTITAEDKQEHEDLYAFANRTDPITVKFEKDTAYECAILIVSRRYP